MDLAHHQRQSSVYDRIINILKKHKNARHKLTPLGFFSASVKNNTEQIITRCRELNDVKNL